MNLYVVSLGDRVLAVFRYQYQAHDYADTFYEDGKYGRGGQEATVTELILDKEVK